MALNCLSGSQRPFHSPASQSPESHPGSSSFQTRPSERAAEEAHFGGHLAGLSGEWCFFKFNVWVPKEWSPQNTAAWEVTPKYRR